MLGKGELGCLTPVGTMLPTMLYQATRMSIHLGTNLALEHLTFLLLMVYRGRWHKQSYI
ncbi:uncharacterized protein EI90DRAFT_3030944 [Cantharellus anzutake]|uniref:uncharacterized protein n=1 Tax=Cantharellus anzutake TaxID=1750568 RepID=UPI00190366C2|nr:uncharacterized protein EI90DRAFT_3030944 [Cantharellus anzutake]KAF8342983.1 hypothetical protein EI90DRAFT_3030944 [Cantharellus anzutake]